MWDTDMKNQEIFWKKKETNWIYLSPGQQYREAEGRLKLRSCLHDSVLNSAPSIEKYINRHYL